MTDLTQPDWIDRTMYPFASHTFAHADGKIHYVDEGEGHTLLFVHGTPTWSFAWRHLITGLRGQYRCVAPDHLGFGLSDKPADADYTPEAHARRLTALIEHLNLQNVTLVVHDFGGPIGLSYAIEHPRNVRDLVIFNTWLWSLKDDRMYSSGSMLFGNPVGRWVYEQVQLSARVILPAAYGDRRKLTREIHRHYLQTHPVARSRRSMSALAKALTGSSEWYGSLWERNAAIRGKPALVLWGMRDTLFPPKQLERWRSALLDAQIVSFDDVGHLVQDEKGADLVPIVSHFLAHGPSSFGQQITGESGNFRR